MKESMCLFSEFICLTFSEGIYHVPLLMMSYVCFSLGELQLRAPRWRDSPPPPPLPSRQQLQLAPLQQLLCVS